MCTLIYKSHILCLYQFLWELDVQLVEDTVLDVACFEEAKKVGLHKKNHIASHHICRKYAVSMVVGRKRAFGL